MSEIAFPAPASPFFPPRRRNGRSRRSPAPGKKKRRDGKVAPYESTSGQPGWPAGLSLATVPFQSGRSGHFFPGPVVPVSLARSRRKRGSEPRPVFSRPNGDRPTSRKVCQWYKLGKECRCARRAGRRCAGLQGRRQCRRLLFTRDHLLPHGQPTDKQGIASSGRMGRSLSAHHPTGRAESVICSPAIRCREWKGLAQKLHQMCASPLGTR